MFNQFLEKNNYIYKNEDDYNVSENEQKIFDNLSNQKISSKIDYIDIPIILDFEEERLITRKQNFKQATHLEKLQLQKYHFLKKIDINLIDDDFKGKLFNLFISNKKSIFHNAYEENLNSIDISLLQLHHIAKSTIENVNINPLKLTYIIKINRSLDIKHSFILKQNIDREKIENLSNFFEHEYTNINIIFGFTNINIKKFDFKNNLILLKKIYKSWSNASFTTDINKSSKKVICCNLIPSDFFYSDKININPFHHYNDEIDSVKINTLDESIKEQSNIDKAILEMEQLKIKRDEDRAREKEEDRLQYERQLILLKKRQDDIDIYYEQIRLQNIICKSCKLKKCKCIKITTFFK